MKNGSIYLLMLWMILSTFDSNANEYDSPVHEIVSEISRTSPGCEVWVVYDEIESGFLPSTSEPIPESATSSSDFEAVILSSSDLEAELHSKYESNIPEPSASSKVYDVSANVRVYTVNGKKIKHICNDTDKVLKIEMSTNSDHEQIYTITYEEEEPIFQSTTSFSDFEAEIDSNSDISLSGSSSADAIGKVIVK